MPLRSYTLLVSPLKNLGCHQNCTGNICDLRAWFCFLMDDIKFTLYLLDMCKFWTTLLVCLTHTKSRTYSLKVEHLKSSSCLINYWLLWIPCMKGAAVRFSQPNEHDQSEGSHELHTISSATQY